MFKKIIFKIERTCLYLSFNFLTAKTLMFLKKEKYINILENINNDVSEESDKESSNDSSLDEDASDEDASDKESEEESSDDTNLINNKIIKANSILIV